MTMLPVQNESSAAMTVPLSTRRLTLQRLNRPFWRQLGWLNNPDNVSFSEQRHQTHTIETVKAYLHTFDHIRNHIWQIVEVDSGHPIGTITVHRDIPNQTAEMGILIGKDYWGKGYGHEAWYRVMLWLFKDCRKIEAGCMATNDGMRAIMAKSGMVQEGMRKAHFLVNDKPVNLLLYAGYP